MAVRATPVLVIRDKRSKMIHADCAHCKGIGDGFPIETTTKWILGFGYTDEVIRSDSESSIVTLGRRVGENSKKQVSRQCETQAQRTTANEQDTQRVVSEL